MKKKIGELLFQIIPVMIGVYLGFVVSNWSANNQKRHQSNVLVNNLISEIETNENKLNNVLDYHIMLRDSSRYYSNIENGGINSNFFKGTRVSKLMNSAFNTGLQTGVINELPIEKIQLINRLYTFQNDYNKFADIMMASLLNRDFSDDDKDRRVIARFLAVTMTDIVIKEKDLIEAYNMIRKKLKE